MEFAGRWRPILAPSWSWSGSAARAVPATIDDLAEGLATACRLVQHGGKIVVLSRVRGALGPALQSLIDIDEPKTAGGRAFAATRGTTTTWPARRFAQALAWADVFVLSGLDPELVDDLSLVVLENPEQARRLASKSGSCSFLSHAELTRAVVREEDESQSDDNRE